MPLEHEDERKTVTAKRERRGAADQRAPDSPLKLRTTKKATLKRTFTEFQADNVTDWAAALTYYSVLALFPALIALVSIVGLAGKSATDSLLENIRDISPGPAREVLTSAVENIAGSQGQAGVAFAIGLLLALNSASGYIAAFTRASNSIYEVEEGRPIWKLKPQQIGIVLVLILLLVIVVLGVVVTGPIAEEVGKVIGIEGDSAVLIFDIAKIPVILLVVSGMFAFLFKATPNVKQPGIKFFSPGGGVALILWILVTALFALYVGTVASYSKTYGSLGGVVAFLVWIWLTNVAILFGAEFNAELQRSQQIEAGETVSLDEPFLEPRDITKLEKKDHKDPVDDQLEDPTPATADATKAAADRDRNTSSDQAPSPGNRPEPVAAAPVEESAAELPARNDAPLPTPERRSPVPAPTPLGSVPPDHGPAERRIGRPRLERLRRILRRDR